MRTIMLACWASRISLRLFLNNASKKQRKHSVKANKNQTASFQNQATSKEPQSFVSQYRKFESKINMTNCTEKFVTERTKRQTIQKGKLIKLKTPRANQTGNLKVADWGSKIVFPSTKDTKYLQNYRSSSKLSKNDKKSSNFLQRMEIDLKLRTYREKSKEKSKSRSKSKSKPRAENKSKPISLKKILLASEIINLQTYEFKNDLEPNSPPNPQNPSALAPKPSPN